MSREVGQDSTGQPLYVGSWVRCRGELYIVLELLDGVSDRGFPAIRLVDMAGNTPFDSDEVAVDLVSTTSSPVAHFVTSTSEQLNTHMTVAADSSMTMSVDYWPWPYVAGTAPPMDEKHHLLMVIADIVREYKMRGGSPSALIDVMRTAFESA